MLRGEEGDADRGPEKRTREPLTVCIATHNGESFLWRQLETICAEIESSDRIIIVDDASTDRTPELLREFALRPNTEVICLERNIGHVRAFATALDHVATPLTMLSDQDDLWPSGRVEKLLETLDEAHVLATGSFETFGQAGAPLRLNAKNNGRFMNVLNMYLGGPWGDVPYWGSCMIVRREVLDCALPIPSAAEAHDQWLGLIANLMGTTVHTNEIVTLRRLHSDNLSPRTRRPFHKALLGKIRLLFLLQVAARRTRRHPSANFG